MKKHERWRYLELLRRLLKELDETNQRAIKDGHGDLLKEIAAEEAANRAEAKAAEDAAAGGEMHVLSEDKPDGDRPTLDSSHLE